ncbi:MAG: ABC transporter permease, partial [Ekhidna sp.]|nr:ABC transporter permease [Ekhidna sp.]
DSTLTTFLATILGLLLAWLLLPWFNILSGKTLTIPIGEWMLVPALFGFILVVGLISGAYPSFYLSSFKPIDVLKGELSRGAKTSKLRGVMVVFQFACSFILIVGAIVVYQQMQFILNKDLGFDKEQVVLLEGAGTMGEKKDLFKSELLQNPQIKSMSVSNYLPVSGYKRDLNQFWKAGRQAIDESVGAQIWIVGEDYLETMGMNLLEGRNFDAKLASDSNAVIINQRMAERLMLDEPIGARIQNWLDWNVIGVVQDFHYESMRGGIEPLVFRRGTNGSIIPIKVKTDDMKSTLESITTVWDDYMPNQPIRVSFLDEAYKRMYADVATTGNVFTGFAVLAIFVACLGLFGLSAFMVEQRRKEISVRKILGASINRIFRMLTFNFLKLILIAFAISIPISYYLMSEWLVDFEYRIDLGWVVFAVASILMTVTAIATISYESLKAAILNPATGLRSE